MEQEGSSRRNGMGRSFLLLWNFFKSWGKIKYKAAGTVFICPTHKGCLHVMSNLCTGWTLWEDYATDNIFLSFSFFCQWYFSRLSQLKYLVLIPFFIFYFCLYVTKTVGAMFDVLVKIRGANDSADWFLSCWWRLNFSQ